MLKVTYGQMRDESFKRGLQKISNCAGLKSPKVAYNVAKISGRFMEEAKLSDELWNKLVHEYAKKDEKGELEPRQGHPGTFWVPEENAAVWLEKLKEYNAIFFEIDRPPLSLDEVMVANLTPLEINALETLLAFDEAPVSEPVKLAKV